MCQNTRNETFSTEQQPQKTAGTTIKSAAWNTRCWRISHKANLSIAYSSTHIPHEHATVRSFRATKEQYPLCVETKRYTRGQIHVITISALLHHSIDRTTGGTSIVSDTHDTKATR